MSCTLTNMNNAQTFQAKTNGVALAAEVRKQLKLAGVSAYVTHLKSKAIWVQPKGGVTAVFSPDQAIVICNVGVALGLCGPGGYPLIPEESASTTLIGLYYGYVS